MAMDFTSRLNLPSGGGLAESINLASGLQQLRALKQAQLAQERQEQERVGFSNELSTLTDYSPQSMVALMGKYPSQQATIKSAHDLLAKDKQAEVFNQALDAYAPLSAGKPELAVERLTQWADAYENKGDHAEAKDARDLVELIGKDPKAALAMASTYLSAAAPEEFVRKHEKLAGIVRAEELQPAKLTEAQSKAEKAAVESKFAESSAAAELQQKGWDLKKMQADVDLKRENTKLAILQAKLAREKGDQKKIELTQKIAQQEAKRDRQVRESTAEVESATSTIDNMLNTADRILSTPMDVVGSAAGPISARIPTLRQSTADFEELVSTIDSQAFMAQIPTMTGKGALSDSEGKKLAAALQNFSLRQSPGRLMANVREAQRLMLKARTNLANKYGVPEVVPETPAAVEQTSPEDINSLIRRYTQ